MSLSRFMVLAIMTLALVFTFLFPSELVYLLIFGYDGVSQFFPGVVFGLFWKRVTKAAVLSGLIAGISLVVFLILAGKDPFLGMNAGFVGLVVNTLITLTVSLMTTTKAGGIK